MNYAAVGLALDLVGVVVLGLVVPPNIVLRAGTGSVGFKNPVGRWGYLSGWGCLVSGFALQLVAVIK